MVFPTTVWVCIVALICFVKWVAFAGWLLAWLFGIFVIICWLLYGRFVYLLCSFVNSCWYLFVAWCCLFVDWCVLLDFKFVGVCDCGDCGRLLWLVC